MVIAVEISEKFLCKNANLTFLEESGWLPNTAAMAHVEVIVDMCMQSTWRTFFYSIPEAVLSRMLTRGIQHCQGEKGYLYTQSALCWWQGSYSRSSCSHTSDWTDKWIQQQLIADFMYQQHSCCCVNIQQLDTNWITTLHASTNIMLLLLKDAFEFCPCESLEVWLDAWLVTYSYLLCLSLLAALISDRHPL